MAGPGDLSATPGQNTTIGGINIAEQCPAANVNDAIRYLAAMIRVTWDNLPTASGGSTTAYVTASNGVFTNQPFVQNRGALLHHNDTALASGRIFVQPAGGAAPAMSNGDILLEY